MLQTLYYFNSRHLPLFEKKNTNPPINSYESRKVSIKTVLNLFPLGENCCLISVLFDLRPFSSKFLVMYLCNSCANLSFPPSPRYITFTLIFESYLMNHSAVKGCNNHPFQSTHFFSTSLWNIRGSITWISCLEIKEKQAINLPYFQRKLAWYLYLFSNQHIRICWGSGLMSKNYNANLSSCWERNVKPKCFLAKAPIKFCEWETTPWYTYF